MPFVKIQDYYVNLDHIAYVKDDGNNVYIVFTDTANRKINLYVPTGSPEASSLLRALNAHLPQP